MSKEVMKLALDALKQIDEAMPFPVAKLAQAVLREALAEQPAQQEPVVWKNAAIRVGEELSSVGPDGYYDMTAEQWLDWAMDQRPYGKNFLPAQRTWAGLTDEDINDLVKEFDGLPITLSYAIEAKLKDKNI